MSDPFCRGAVGAKYMDLASVRSVSFSTHKRFSMITNGNGIQSYFLAPNYEFDPQATSTVITGDFAAFGGNFASSGNIQVQACRLVSWGFIVRSIAAPLSASGMVRIRGFVANNASSIAGNVDTGTYNSDFYMDVPLQECRHTAIVGKRSDQTCSNWRSSSSINPSPAVAAAVANGFGFYVLSVVGGPVSTTVADVEVYMNWEVQLLDDQNLQQLATPPPPYDYHISNAAHLVSSVMTTGFLGGPLAAANEVARLAIVALRN